MADDYGYGLVFTKKSFRDQYRNSMRNKQGFNIWNEAYGTIGMYEKASLSSLDYDYNKAMGEAYVAAQGQKNIIAESGLGKGFKQELYGDIDENLMDAYIQYKQNYMQNVEKVTETADKYRSEITSDLEYTASQSEKFKNAVYDYYNYLYETNPELFTAKGENLDRRFDRFIAEDGHLLTEQELNKLNFNEIAKKDELGNDIYEYELNSSGVDFYDQMINWMGEDGPEMGFSEWLYDKSQDEKGDYAGLYDWYNEYNPYADALKNPSNAGLFRTAVGLVSDDYTYQFVERFGGLNEEQIKDMYSEYTKKYEDMKSAIEKNGKDKGKEYTKQVSGYITEIHQMAKTFGLEDDIENYFKENGINGGWSDLENYIDACIKGTTSQGDMAGQWFKDFGIGLGVGVVSGVGTVGISSAAAGPAGFVVGLVAAIVEIVGATVGGIIAGSVDVDKQRKNNETYAKAANETYNALLKAMTQASLAKKREGEINEYNRRRNQFI